MYNIAMLSKEVVELEHLAFELLMTFVSVMTAKALDELVDALKERGRDEKGLRDAPESTSRSPRQRGAAFGRPLIHIIPRRG